jgi:murein tripeptide amidase MpaA
MPPPYPDITAPLRAQQVEDALADLAASFPALCTRTVFAGKTSEGRSHSYIKIAHGTGARPAVLVTGGVHAREWAPPDALVTFARNLLVAYQAGADITFGSMQVTPLSGAPVTYRPWKIKAADVAAIVNTLDLYLFPLVNPDGREFDLTPPITVPGWRKNRSPQTGGQFGVDLNRNFNVIWKFEDYYDVPLYNARYHEDPASRNPADDTFRGPGEHSEQETRNVESLLDTLPIHYYADVHMAGRNVLFSWGLEENGNDTTMTFQNAAFTGKRDGLKAGDPALPAGRTDYKEFLPDALPHRVRTRAEFIANAMRDKILESGNGGTLPVASSTQQFHSQYTVGQSAFLYLPLGGPNSGVSDDYACSRQFVLANRMPIFAYTLETGHATEQLFHCAYTDPPGHFRKINREIHAALLALLQIAVASPLPKPPSSGPCLVATATMGEANHPDVLFLRALRDERLRATPRGARLADLLDRAYYSVSPAIAGYLDGHPWARTAVRRMVIRPLVAALRRALGPGSADGDGESGADSGADGGGR